MFGLLNIYKPPGPTSHDVVVGVRRALPRKTKIGHAGTLDPLAEGVLVLCIGPATRLAEHIQNGRKRYLTDVTLGARSTTDDLEGELTHARDVTPPGIRQVRESLAPMRGDIMQAPPAHSAVHVEGRRAYDLARRGQLPDLQARPVTVHSLDLVDYDYPRVTLRVVCSSGTYIRSLARDLGEALGTGGYCSRIVREGVGAFSAESAVRLGELDVHEHLLPPIAALADLPQAVVSQRGEEKLAMGQKVAAANTRLTGDPPNGAEMAVVSEDGRLLALATYDASRLALCPRKVFVKK
ncbi:MAG: tRNA pseudouridine(55) synthase TruB [Phycisphaerae bacterium]